MNNKKSPIISSKKSLLFTLLCLWQLSLQASPVRPSPELKAFEAHYTLSKKGFTVAEMKRQLTIEGNKVKYHSYATAAGIAALFISDTITEQSIMIQDKNGLKPLSYSYERQGGSKHELTKLDFDWSKKRVHNSYLKKALPLSENTFDLLGFQIIIAQQLGKGVKTIQFNVVEKKEIKRYTFTQKGTEQLKLAVAKPLTDTIHLGFYDKKKKRQLDIWAAPSLNYLPVRIKRTDDDGDTTLLEYFQPKYKNRLFDEDED